MNLEELSYRLDCFYKNPPTNLIMEIPAGTGICHIANVPASNWKSGFIWGNEGRWKLPGELKKHYGDILQTCSIELFGKQIPDSEKITCEIWEAQRTFPALNIAAFPNDMQKAFYEDYGPPPQKWEKPNLAVEKFYSYPMSQGICSVYAPSASGILLEKGGSVLVTNPNEVNLRLLETGSYALYQNNLIKFC